MRRCGRGRRRSCDSSSWMRPLFRHDWNSWAEFREFLCLTHTNGFDFVLQLLSRLQLAINKCLRFMLVTLFRCKSFRLHFLSESRGIFRSHETRAFTLRPRGSFSDRALVSAIQRFCCLFASCSRSNRCLSDKGFSLALHTLQDVGVFR